MGGAPLSDGELLGRWRAVGAWLERWRGLWEPPPFLGLPVGWERAEPELAAWVGALPEEEVERLERDIGAAAVTPGAPATLVALLGEGAALTALGQWGGATLGEVDRYGVKARKGEQIRRFVEAALPRLPEAGPLVDWCAGKGHLGRLLSAASGLEVRALERDPALVASGQALAADLGVSTCSFICADATRPEGAAALVGARGAFALHACGWLGDHLIAGAVAAGLGWVAMAPCCYWRLGGAEVHTPRSRAGRAEDLRLDGASMRLACNEERTGTPRAFAERRRHMAWRLGLDALRREATGATRYTASPAGLRELLHLPFGDFARAACTQLGVPLPAVWDEARGEAAGWAEMRRVRAHGLVRAPFRRALELWLALDRALALQEAGYEVEVGVFCPEALTPRNLLVMARR